MPPPWANKKRFRSLARSSRKSLTPSDQRRDRLHSMSASSNRKPGQPAPQPNEPFKQAVASALRALAQTREMEVTYAADKPALMGHGEGAKAACRSRRAAWARPRRRSCAATPIRWR